MQLFEIAAIVFLVVAAVVFLASRRLSRRGDDTGTARLVIGSVLGLLGAIVILAPEIDVVPDVWQGPVEPLLIGGITLLLIVGSVYRMVR